MPYSDYLSDLFGNALVTTAVAGPGRTPTWSSGSATPCSRLYSGRSTTRTRRPQILKKANPTADIAAATGEIKLMTPYVKPDRQRARSVRSTSSGSPGPSPSCRAPVSCRPASPPTRWSRST